MNTYTSATQVQFKFHAELQKELGAQVMYISIILHGMNCLIWNGLLYISLLANCLPTDHVTIL